MNLNKFGAIKIARALAEQSGLTITFEGEMKPRTDGKVIFVQSPDELWGEEHWTDWWACLYHEIGHNVPEMRDVFDLIKDKQIDMSSFFGVGINILDDYRQEHYKFGELAGRSHYLGKGHAQILRRHVDKRVYGKSVEDERMAVEALMCYDTYERESFMGGYLGGIWTEFYNMLQAKSKAWVDDMIRIDFDFNSMETADDVYVTWKRIQDEVFKFNSEEKEEESKTSGGGKASGEGDEGDAAEGTGDTQGDGEGEGEGDGDSKDGRIDYSDILKDNHAEREVGSTQSKLTIQYGDDTSGSFASSPDVKLVDYSKGEIPASTCDNSWVTKHIDMGGGKGLVNTVRRLLQIRSKAKNVYGQKSGKVNGRSLYRLGMKDATGFNERVFKRRTNSDVLDVAVTVLGDHSGSMGGDPYSHMASACIMLNEALSTIGVPMELLGFTEAWSETTIIKYKSFASRTNTQRLVDGYMSAADLMGSNADGEAIMYAYSSLIKQKAKRKIMIVLSDGQPASMRGDADAHTRHVVKTIEKQGHVEIYGIGIMDDNVERIYKAHKVIHKASDLESALLTVIKTKIIK